MVICAPLLELPDFKATNGMPFCKAFSAALEKASTLLKPSICMPMAVIFGSSSSASIISGKSTPALLPTVII